jgi:hypothetical protein
MLRLLDEYVATLKILFPCRRRHLAVANLMKVAMDEWWSVGMVFGTTEEALEG